MVLLGECDGQNYRQAVIAGSVKKIHVAILVLLVLCLESYSFVPYMFLLVIVCNRLICLCVTHAALIKTYPVSSPGLHMGSSVLLPLVRKLEDIFSALN